MKSIDTLWQEYSAAVDLGKTSVMQRREMRRAFYAGTLSTLTELRTIDEDTSDEEGCRQIQLLTDECETFMHLIGQGGR